MAVVSLYPAAARDESSVRRMEASAKRYEEALIKQELGRSAEAAQLLDEAIRIAPENVEARLLRNAPEDRSYVMEHAPSADVQVYVDAARDAWSGNRREQARTIMANALQWFPTLFVAEVRFAFDADEISFSRILQSLQTRSDTWYCPNWCLQDGRYLAGNDRILIWDSYPGPVELSFSRYGFRDTSIRLTSGFETILERTMEITRVQTPPTPNTVIGRVTSAGSALRSSGIHVTIADEFGPNLGFRRSATTDDGGVFILEDVPNGTFEIRFNRRGRVPYGLSVDVKDGVVRCRIDARRHYDRVGITPCDLLDAGFELHPVRMVAIRWSIQQHPEADDFGPATRMVRLWSASPHDWYRGFWTCCDSSFRFGTAEKNAIDPDLVVFTDTDGVSYFAQPVSPSIAVIDDDFETLDRVPKNPYLTTHVEVREGQTYVLRTRETDAGITFFVKLQVVAVLPSIEFFPGTE